MAPAVAASPPAFPEPSVSGPGPIRHPRPITASDLHMQLEKEQEAVVRQADLHDQEDQKLTMRDR